MLQKRLRQWLEDDNIVWVIVNFKCTQPSVDFNLNYTVEAA